MSNPGYLLLSRYFWAFGTRAHSYAYFGTDSDPGIVVKAQLGSGTTPQNNAPLFSPIVLYGIIGAVAASVGVLALVFLKEDW